MTLEEILINRHKDDEQLGVIFSRENKLMVEAPAGCGKTKTIISLISYLLGSGQIQFPKRILALSFSVNAATKIKLDILLQLPEILEVNREVVDKYIKQVVATNYHGLARMILKKYGYLIDSNLKNIDKMHNIDCSERELVPYIKNEDKMRFLLEYSSAVNNADWKYLRDNMEQYNSIICMELIKNNAITYDAILTMAIKLLYQYPAIMKFYKSYFSCVIIDEYQDTNYLGYSLIYNFINEDTRLIIMGDPLQKIYGFIGALPNIMDGTRKVLNMATKLISKNYRYAGNPQMLALDRMIRANASYPQININDTECVQPLYIFEDQEEEATWICQKVSEIIGENKDVTIAILCNTRGNNINAIIGKLDEMGIRFFYGLFRDTEEIYIDFHRYCLDEFNSIFTSKKVTASNLKQFESHIALHYCKTREIESLLKLLSSFFNIVLSDYFFLSDDEKKNIIRETFDSLSLRQNMKIASERLVVSTIHGAKGLEWDYVFMPDMEQFVNPGFFSCSACINGNFNTITEQKCIIKMSKDFEQEFLNMLSVFYVGSTRAKKQVIYSSSKKRLGTRREEYTYVSCFLNLPGIKLNIM